MELCTLKRNFEEAVEFSETFGKECRATKCLYARYNDPSIFVITMVSKFMYCGELHNSGRLGLFLLSLSYMEILAL